MSDEPLEEREADPADAAEQRRPATGDDGTGTGNGSDDGMADGIDDGAADPPPDEADRADAIDQRRAVPVDDDDYR
ncbi:hypothetical protein POF50_013895 [Streptomyces sp. SL13]|uniref:Uncharacterized protein n=1 Tax=Streptantibioticus silvisoli TaxID=2705255 RepID=A0AA90H446_9ACTN|nr:hypothetical protein [Streptantibioticus silvisoli]MDI5970420.1 hypothetical protein [Streptantibioticus silvisoli]